MKTCDDCSVYLLLATDKRFLALVALVSMIAPQLFDKPLASGPELMFLGLAVTTEDVKDEGVMHVCFTIH